MKKWIVADSEHLGGSPRVRDTRISVALILECLEANMTIAEIVDAYPALSDEAVRGVLAELAEQQDPDAYLEERAAKATGKGIANFLAKSPNVEPPDWDRLPDKK